MSNRIVETFPKNWRAVKFVDLKWVFDENTRKMHWFSNFHKCYISQITLVRDGVYAYTTDLFMTIIWHSSENEKKPLTHTSLIGPFQNVVKFNYVFQLISIGVIFFKWPLNVTFWDFHTRLFTLASLDGKKIFTFNHMCTAAECVFTTEGNFFSFFIRK